MLHVSACRMLLTFSSAVRFFFFFLFFARAELSSYGERGIGIGGIGDDDVTNSASKLGCAFRYGRVGSLQTNMF